MAESWSSYEDGPQILLGSFSATTAFQLEKNQHKGTSVASHHSEELHYKAQSALISGRD